MQRKTFFFPLLLTGTLAVLVAASFYGLGRPLRGSFMSRGFAMVSPPNHQEDALGTETVRFLKII